MQRLATTDADFAARLAALTEWDAGLDAAVERTVAEILADVRVRGDAALLEYTARFDQLQLASGAELEIPRERIDAALTAIPAAQREALQQAATRVRSYHEHQRQDSWQYRDAEGNLLGQQITALDRVGIYVPGGKASYPSSVLMNALPAHVAGVAEIIMVVPAPGGELNDLVLAAAAIAGGDRVFTLGGGGLDLRHRHGAGSGQDCRPREYLCRHRQAPGVRPGRDRHGGGPLGDSGDLRWLHRSRLGDDGSVLSGRA